MSTRLHTIRVPLGERPYDVVVGRGAVAELSSFVPKVARQAVVVTEAGVPVHVEVGLPTTVVEIPHGERAKSLEVIESVVRRFAAAGLDRRDVVVAVGGGVVTDVGGFAAAVWHRGTPVIHVPTTLLGQIDAAVGGKTGVNLPEGKNLVGAYWQPLGVLCDPDVLASLPPGEWRSGYGEMAKYAFLGVDRLEDLELTDQIARCVECKVAVVAADEREGGLRATLNYGHTLAHALEAEGLADADGRPLRHGEAVAVGLVFAARLARALDRIDDARVRRHEEVVAAYGLPSALPPGSDPGRLIDLMRRDKKAHGDLTFVLDGPRGVEPVSGVDPGVVLAVLGEMPVGEMQGSRLE